MSEKTGRICKLLSRSGNAPLRIEGTVLRTANGNHWAGRDQTRWYELTIYRLQDGRYAAQTVYRTCWLGEAEFFRAEVCDSPQQVVGFFREWNPILDGIGYPQHEKYTDRQAALEVQLRRQYDDLVKVVLDDEAFAEIPQESRS